jgi:hypothetical protein
MWTAHIHFRFVSKVLWHTVCVCVTRLTIDSLAFVLRVLLLQQTPVWPCRNRSADQKREIYMEQAAKYTAFPPTYANEHSVEAALHSLEVS